MKTPPRAIPLAQQRLINAIVAKVSRTVEKRLRSRLAEARQELIDRNREHIAAIATSVEAELARLDRLDRDDEIASLLASTDDDEGEIVEEDDDEHDDLTPA